MHPSEDPEQRIRDLESGVSTSDQYGAPPPETPPAASAGTDKRWVSNVLFGLGLLIVILGIAAFLVFGREPTAGTPVAADPPTPTRTATPPRTTTARPSVPMVPPVIPRPPSVDRTPPTVVAAGGTLRVSGIDEQRTVTCDGGTVEISGITNTVDIKGHCGRVDVSGIENVVTVDSADVIDGSGISNRITFHEGAPQINTSGSGVTVEQG